MRIRASAILQVTLAVALVPWMRSLAAQEMKASPPAKTDGTAPYGVAVAPPIYLINFLFLYTANPDIAAFMPAYRAPIPQSVFGCLEQNPMGCPFNEQDFNGADGGTKSR